MLVPLFNERCGLARSTVQASQFCTEQGIFKKMAIKVHQLVSRNILPSLTNRNKHEKDFCQWFQVIPLLRCNLQLFHTKIFISMDSPRPEEEMFVFGQTAYYVIDTYLCSYREMYMGKYF
jgi:hypothetical protein